MSTYSTRFALVREDLSASPVLYTVPANNIIVLRDVCLRNLSGVATTMQLGVTSGSITVPIQQYLEVPQTGVEEWQGRHVLNAGDQFWAYCANGLAQCIASGYLLAT